MALKKHFTLSGTASVKTEIGDILVGGSQANFRPYIKVISVSGGKDLMQISVEMVDGGTRLVHTHEFTPSVADGAENFIKQAYDHIKTLELYAGSEDV